MEEIKNFEGKYVFHPAEALVILRLSKNLETAQKTAANKICQKKFPIKLDVVAGKNMVLAATLIRELAGQTCGIEEQVESDATVPIPTFIAPTPVAKRRPGRPKKMEVAA